MPETTPTKPRTCEHETMVDGPHPGCAEFAPPDVVPCGEVGTYVVTWYGTQDGRNWELDSAITCSTHWRGLLEALEDGTYWYPAHNVISHRVDL